jgi:hypothetical protein
MSVQGIGLAGQPPYHLGMDRRRFLLTSLAAALTVPVTAEGQHVDVSPSVSHMARLTWS